jgi:hypothetical protein
MSCINTPFGDQNFMGLASISSGGPPIIAERLKDFQSFQGIFKPTSEKHHYN